MANLIPAQSADFEGAGTGNWAAWFGCTVAKSTLQANTGTGSLEIDATGSSVGITHNAWPGWTGFTASTDYLIAASLWKTNPARTVSVNFIWQNEAGSELRTDTLSIVAGGSAWATQSTTVTSPVGTTRLYMTATFAGNANDFVYLDTVVADDAPGGGGVARDLTGVGPTAASASGLVAVARPLSGAGNAADSATGALLAQRPVSGTASAATTGSGALSRARPVTGTAAAAATAAGAIVAERAIAGAVQAATSATGQLTVNSDATLNGDVVAASTATGELTVERPLVGVAAQAAIAAAGALIVLRPLFAVAPAVAVASTGLTGHLAIDRTLTGVAGTAHNMAGALTVISPVTWAWPPQLGSITVRAAKPGQVTIRQDQPGTITVRQVQPGQVTVT